MLKMFLYLNIVFNCFNSSLFQVHKYSFNSEECVVKLTKIFVCVKFCKPDLYLKHPLCEIYNLK